MKASRDQLRAHPYDFEAGDLVRFRVEANDDIVAGVVRTVIAEGDEGRSDFLQSLDEEGAATLRLFAMRRTLHGRRQSSLSLAYEALDAFALLPTVDDVPWDSWLKAALFVTRSLGGDVHTISRRFAEVASADLAARYDIAKNAMNRVEQLSQCQIIEVTTNHGVGFLENLVFRDPSRTTFYGSGIINVTENRIDYQPTSDLAQLTVSLADAMDASNQVMTGPISQDQLAASSFSLTVAGSYLATTGCLSFVADAVDEDVSFTVFVAEPSEDADIAVLAAAAIATGNQAAVHDDRRLIVLSAQPNFDDDSDLAIDFHAFESVANAMLMNPGMR